VHVEPGDYACTGMLNALTAAHANTHQCDLVGAGWLCISDLCRPACISAALDKPCGTPDSKHACSCGAVLTPSQLQEVRHTCTAALGASSGWYQKPRLLLLLVLLLPAACITQAGR
jgi:hypothetical protein